MAMKVSELMRLLSKEDPDDLVVMSKDSEGNGYSPLSGLYRATYLPESTWSGDVFQRSPLSEEDLAAGYEEGEDTTDDPDAVPCVVLGPVN